MNSARRAAVLLAVALALAGAARADIVCRIASVTSLAFGAYDPLSPVPTDSQASVTVACDRNAGPATVAVSMGLNQGSWGGSVVARRLGQSGGGDQLGYGLFRDSGRASNWGNSDGIDTVVQPVTVPNKGSASTVFTIYARIPPQQDVSAGNYADAVRITVSP